MGEKIPIWPNREIQNAAHPEMDTLESTNRLLNSLERQLLVLLNLLDQTYQSHSSLVVVDPAMAGLARQSVQLSVLLYIRDDGFDPDQVFTERQRVTQFSREYLPQRDGGRAAGLLRELGGPGSPEIGPTAGSDDGSELSASSENSPAHDPYVFDENDYDDDYDDMLLPPLPPRLPPRQMDPDKLYGLYDFSGPDPLHCTLSRDEPVHLVNDLDNYWWLIRKMLLAERAELGGLPGLDDGKIGFVPAECLETYVERLARLNCFRNEELERVPEEAEGAGAADETAVPELPHLPVPESGAKPALGRSGSILKKTGSLRHHNKLVTFENLCELNFDEPSDDDVDFNVYSVSHDDISHLAPHSEDENRSEVISDQYPPETPLHIKKTPKRPIAPPAVVDDASIGSFSPDTPDLQFDRTSEASSEASELRNPPTTTSEGEPAQPLRRSLIMDRFEQVFGDDDDDTTFDFYSGYDDDRYDLDRSVSDENVTPLTSMNSLQNFPLPPKNAVLEKKKKEYDGYLPILGKLDELSERLAEFESSL